MTFSPTRMQRYNVIGRLWWCWTHRSVRWMWPRPYHNLWQASKFR